MPSCRAYVRYVFTQSTSTRRSPRASWELMQGERIKLLYFNSRPMLPRMGGTPQSKPNPGHQWRTIAKAKYGHIYIIDSPRVRRLIYRAFYVITSPVFDSRRSERTRPLGNEISAGGRRKMHKLANARLLPEMHFFSVSRFKHALQLERISTAGDIVAMDHTDFLYLC